MNSILKSYAVRLNATAHLEAIVFVDAMSPEDAAEIARSSCKAEDFETLDLGQISVEETKPCRR